MTHFKKMLAIAALFTIGLAHAKQMVKKTTTAPITTPVTQPIQPIKPQTKPLPQPKQQPSSSSAKASADRAKTFKQLYNEVKNAKNAWDYKTQLLSETFVNNLFNDAQTAKISNMQFDFLILFAQDCHAQFTGPKKDIDILKGLQNQRVNISYLFADREL